MGAFEFNALDAHGKQRKGVLEGDTPRQVRQLLRDKGWVPLNVEEIKQQQQNKSRGRLGGVSAKDLALFTRQIATLVNAGSPVEEALGAVSRQTEKARIKSLLLAVRARVMEGFSLAVALGDFPNIFPQLYRATVSAGEQSGFLSAVLERLADYTENRHAMTQNITMALIYPVILVVVSIAIVIGLITYVVPGVVGVFESSNQQLPLATRILIGISGIMQDYGIGIFVVVIGIAYIARRALKTEAVKFRFHRMIINWPIIGKIIRGVNAARFARTLSILNASGVPVLDALRISAQVVENLPMRKAVEEAAKNVREGGAIHRSLEVSGYFPPMTLHLIASGESSGRLEEMLERAAINQERELQATINALMALLAPMVVLGMGVVVLFIMGAIMLPILQMNQLIK